MNVDTLSVEDLCINELYQKRFKVNKDIVKEKITVKVYVSMIINELLKISLSENFYYVYR